MKKLFLLLILSYFSAQSFAGSCPDGSDPVKSVSADGTYFVYNCGGQSSSSTNTGSWNDPGPLDELTIPDNWQLFKNNQVLEYTRKKNKTLTRRFFNEKVCLSVVKEWGKSMELQASTAGKKEKDESSAFGADNQDIPADLLSCLDNFIFLTQKFTGTPDYMKEILLHWAKTDAVFIPNGVQNDILDDYIYLAVQSWSAFGSYYGTFYDEFNYSDSERKIVDAYIKDKLLNINTRNRASDGKTCDPDNLERTIQGQFSMDPRNRIDADTCGSSVWKTTLAQLLVGLRLNDKALFKKGVENTKWQLSFFDDTGIFTTWAIKGSASYKYTSHVPIMLGGLTEIYASLGFDFMEYKLRNGLSVKQLMDRQYEILLDPHILDNFVKRYPHDYKGTPNSAYLHSSAEKIRNDAGLNLFAFVRNLPRYIDTYRADIGNSQEFDEKLRNQSEDVINDVISMSTGNFQPLDPYLAYISDITEPEPEIDSDEDKLKGEYDAKWYIGNTFNKPVTFEYKGKDNLTLERGKGVFSGAGSFFPSRGERRKLKIDYKQNGKITVEGNLKIFHDNKSYPTFLDGDINSGLITGVWEEGDLIKIEITKKPEINSSKTTKTTETTSVAASDGDPTVSKIIEVIHGDTFIVNIAEPHELAGSNIKLIIRDANTPDATKSCAKQMEIGIKVKDIVTQKLADASSIKIKNFRKTSKAIIAQVIVDGKDLGTELIEKGYASDEYGHWKAYFCSALQAMTNGDSNWKYSTVDVDKAIFWYERAIFLDPDRDQSLVTYELSELYKMNGDTKKSIDYLKQSAKLGYMQAEEALGAAYMNGKGVSKDPKQAKKWLKKAHENGSDSAEDICGCKF